MAQQQSLEAEWGELLSSRTAKLHSDGHGDPIEWIAKLQELRCYENGDVHLLYEFHFEDGRWELFRYRVVG